jgi:hypothetical protein
MRCGWGCLIGGIFDLAFILLVIGSFYIHWILGLALVILFIFCGLPFPGIIFSELDDDLDSKQDSVTQKQTDATPAIKDIQYDHLVV